MWPIQSATAYTAVTIWPSVDWSIEHACAVIFVFSSSRCSHIGIFGIMMKRTSILCSILIPDHEIQHPCNDNRFEPTNITFSNGTFLEQHSTTSICRSRADFRNGRGTMMSTLCVNVVLNVTQSRSGSPRMCDCVRAKWMSFCFGESSMSAFVLGTNENR